MRLAFLFLISIALCSCTYLHFEKLSNICANSNLSITAATKNASSCGSSDGSIIVTANGGAQNYLFNLDAGEYQQNSVFTNLSSGNYNVTVKDSLGCTSSQIVSVNTDGTSIKISVTTTADSGCPTGNGTITISVGRAASPIQYRINTGQYQPGNLFTNLKGGSYSIDVIDATNCKASSVVSVARSGPGFAASISPIISTNCSISGCHNGSRSPNLSSYNNISANASSIVSSINSNMPPGNRLSQQQIDLIKCWANDGAPNN